MYNCGDIGDNSSLKERISCPFLIRGKHEKIINIRDEKYQHKNTEILMDTEDDEGDYIYMYIYICICT
jgi:hypothetical protein